jgi:hypothetical protein
MRDTRLCAALSGDIARATRTAYAFLSSNVIATADIERRIAADTRRRRVRVDARRRSFVLSRRRTFVAS